MPSTPYKYLEGRVRCWRQSVSLVMGLQVAGECLSGHLELGPQGFFCLTGLIPVNYVPCSLVAM